MNKCLVVVDVQNDFVTGALANLDAAAAMPTVKNVVDYARNNEWDLIFTKDTHGEMYPQTQEGRNLPVPHCIYGSWGWQIVDGLVPDDDYYVIMKNQFGYEGWDIEEMRHYDEVVFCGFVSSICVCSNVLCFKAQYPEIPVTFICDASAGLTPEDHAAACQVLRSCQVKVVTWNEYLTENV